mmetsp:Transcript_22773/g.38967  ORF Transcript_22773/g.38967 Transcript_22773/m.38967 type:complete len:81 (+) Transcript_22773:515-757(+)
MGKAGGTFTTKRSHVRKLMMLATQQPFVLASGFRLHRSLVAAADAMPYERTVSPAKRGDEGGNENTIRLEEGRSVHGHVA